MSKDENKLKEQRKIKMKSGNINQNDFKEWHDKLNLDPSTKVNYNYQKQLSSRNHYLT